MPFGGTTYDPAQDRDRLGRQLRATLHLMRDGHWHTLEDLSVAVGALLNAPAPEASVSARLRDLRKEKFGGWVVERRRFRPGSGLYEYRLLPPLHLL